MVDCPHNMSVHNNETRDLFYAARCGKQNCINGLMKSKRANVTAADERLILCLAAKNVIYENKCDVFNGLVNNHRMTPQLSLENMAKTHCSKGIVADYTTL